MTRNYPSARLLSLSGIAVLFAGFLAVSAQELPASPAAPASALRTRQTTSPRNQSVRQTSKRSANRRLVKIRVRAGDTLRLLGDRFGITAEEIAGLNNISIATQISPGSELLIPLPSPEMLVKASLEKLAQHNDKPPGADRISSIEADDSWENVQGVWFRKGSTRRAKEVNQASGNSRVDDNAVEAEDTPLAKIVDVAEAERSRASQPILIYLVGGACVEADSVNETAEGVWYAHGNLTIFIERTRIERIERERPANVPAPSGSWIERGWTTGNAKFDTLIRENGVRFGVDPYLIFCVMEQESQFKPWVVSPKGARGLMQLMPGTAARFGVRRPFDPAENIMGGTRYLKLLLESFGGRVDLVLAGYNAGEGAVMKFGGNVPPYKETRTYVQRISKRYGQDRSFAPDVKVTGSTLPGLR